MAYFPVAFLSSDGQNKGILNKQGCSPPEVNADNLQRLKQAENTNTNTDTNANANTKQGCSAPEENAYNLQTLGDADEETKKSDSFVVVENNTMLTVLPI